MAARRQAPEAALFLAGAGFLHRGLHWTWWAALGAALGAAVVIGFARAAITDLFFRPVPDQLLGPVADKRAEGWRRARIHTIMCDRTLPHVHLVHEPDGAKLVLTDAGQQVTEPG